MVALSVDHDTWRYSEFSMSGMRRDEIPKIHILRWTFTFSVRVAEIRGSFVISVSVGKCILRQFQSI